MMCLSFPRLVAMDVSRVRGGEVLAILRGAVGVWTGVSEASVSLEASESTLDESSGMSCLFGLDRTMSIAGVVASFGCVSQHSVSRFQIRQLMFSSRRPSSTVSAHLEKTEEAIRGMALGNNEGAFDSPLHMPNKFSTFLVSTLRILAESTDSIGISNLTGIVCVKNCAERKMYWYPDSIQRENESERANSSGTAKSRGTALFLPEGVDGTLHF